MVKEAQSEKLIFPRCNTILRGEVMSTPFRIIDRIRWRLGIQDPLPPPKQAALTPPRIPQPSMKKPELPPVKTYGVEHDARIYGALPFSREQIQQGAQLAKNEAEAHERENHTPILSVQGTGAPIGTSSGGIGLSDQELLRRTAQWEMEQKALLADRNFINTIVPNACGTVGIKTFHN